MNKFLTIILCLFSISAFSLETIHIRGVDMTEMTKAQVQKEIEGDYYVYSPPQEGIFYDPDNGLLGIVISSNEILITHNFVQTIFPAKGSGNITGKVPDHASYSNGKWFVYSFPSGRKLYYYTYYEFYIEYMMFENTKWIGNGSDSKPALTTSEKGLFFSQDDEGKWLYIGNSGTYRFEKFGAEEIARVEAQKKEEEIRRQKAEEKKRLQELKRQQQREQQQQEQERDLNHIDSDSKEMQIQHVVVKGEGLYRIAQKYDVSTKEILELNPVLIQKGLSIGQVLIIPKKSRNSANQYNQVSTPVEKSAEKSQLEIDIYDMNLEAERKEEEARRASLRAQGYVDLGLPSGAMWKNKNEEGGFYTYDEAMSKFKNDLPTEEQLIELKDKCTWTWMDNGYKVMGPNGNSIFLPAAGYRFCDGSVGRVGWNGYYWSSTPGGSKFAWYLYFNSGSVSMYSYSRCNGLFVRLVR